MGHALCLEVEKQCSQDSFSALKKRSLAHSYCFLDAWANLSYRYGWAICILFLKGCPETRILKGDSSSIFDVNHQMLRTLIEEEYAHNCQAKLL